MFKGNFAQLVRVFPSTGIQFSTYETLKVYLPKVTGLEKNHQTLNFIAGAGAGLTSVSLTFPLDTIRARVAFQALLDAIASLDWRYESKVLYKSLSVCKFG